MKPNAVAKVVAAGAMLVTLAGCAVNERSLQERGLKPLSAEQLKPMFATSRTLLWQGNGNTGTAEFRPDGSASVSSGPRFTDSGSYRIVDDGWCTQYKIIRKGQETCFRIYETGANAYTAVNDQGVIDSTFSLR